MIYDIYNKYNFFRILIMHMYVYCSYIEFKNCYFNSNNCCLNLKNIFEYEK